MGDALPEFVAVGARQHKPQHDSVTSSQQHGVPHLTVKQGPHPSPGPGGRAQSCLAPAVTEREFP